MQRQWQTQLHAAPLWILFMEHSLCKDTDTSARRDQKKSGVLKRNDWQGGKLKSVGTWAAPSTHYADCVEVLRLNMACSPTLCHSEWCRRVEVELSSEEQEQKNQGGKKIQKLD